MRAGADALARWEAGRQLDAVVGARARTLVGLDEVGRGAWAGPVVSAAVVLAPGVLIVGVDDSKQLSATQRAVLSRRIREQAAVGVGWALAGEVDALGLYAATARAMRRALMALPVQADVALVDGPWSMGLGIEERCLVRGDERSNLIAAASIVAKVARDRWMERLAGIYPGYGWERNRGYGTREHVMAIERCGPTAEHRRRFLHGGFGARRAASSR